MNEYETDPTPKAELCSEIKCAEYRDHLECKVQRLEEKVSDLQKKLAAALCRCGSPKETSLSLHVPSCEYWKVTEKREVIEQKCVQCGSEKVQLGTCGPLQKPHCKSCCDSMWKGISGSIWKASQ